MAGLHVPQLTIIQGKGKRSTERPAGKVIPKGAAGGTRGTCTGVQKPLGSEIKCHFKQMSPLMPTKLPEAQHWPQDQVPVGRSQPSPYTSTCCSAPVPFWACNHILTQDPGLSLPGSEPLLNGLETIEYGKMGFRGKRRKFPLDVVSFSFLLPESASPGTPGHSHPFRRLWGCTHPHTTSFLTLSSSCSLASTLPVSWPQESKNSQFIVIKNCKLEQDVSHDVFR